MGPALGPDVCPQQTSAAAVLLVCVVFLPSPQGRSLFGGVQASLRAAWMLPNLGCYSAVDGLWLRVCWRGWVHRVWEEHEVSNICAALPWESTCHCFVEFLCSLLGAGMGGGDPQKGVGKGHTVGKLGGECSYRFCRCPGL